MTDDYNDWIDVVGSATADEIEAMIFWAAPIVEAYQIRADLFTNYPDGRTVRRVYLRRKRFIMAQVGMAQVGEQGVIGRRRLQHGHSPRISLLVADPSPTSAARPRNVRPCHGSGAAAFGDP